MSVAALTHPANGFLGVSVQSNTQADPSADRTAQTSVGDATACAAEGSALVHRRQSFPRGSKAESDQWRRVRFERRSMSSRWLISDAIDASSIEEVRPGVFVDTETGELHQSNWVRPPRPARCSWRIGPHVGIHSNGKMAHFSGTERCSSIWACPVCSAVIRAERAREITRAVEAHHATGGSILFVTLTIRHKKADSLKQGIDAVLGSWKKLLQGRAWVGGRNKPGMRQRYGVEGYIRSTEVTYGVNGWHPHIHALVFTNRSLDDLEITAFGDEIHDRWARFVKQATGLEPTRQHGIDVQRVDTKGKILGKYLSKMQDQGESKTEKWDASAELARADVKVGQKDHYVPFELLDKEHRLPAAQRRRLWAEYVKYTRGRRAITWSRGLKQRYNVEEKTDDDIIDDTESAPIMWVAYGKEYDRIRKTTPEVLAQVLEAAERDDWQKVAEILPGELPPDPPPDDP